MSVYYAYIEQHLAANAPAPGGTQHRTRARPRRRARPNAAPAQMSRPLRLASSYALVQRRSSEPSASPIERMKPHIANGVNSPV